MNVIPKTIHYVWVGGNPLPKEAKKYIKTWKQYCPDYEIREWNEKNFDINQFQFTKEAYAQKKYAFVSDVVRLWVLYNYGGVYMDTDVEVVRNLDEFLNDAAFSGFEDIDKIPTGIMAAKKHHPLFKELLDYYANLPFVNQDGTPNDTPNTEIITNTLTKEGLKLNNKKQTILGFTLYPKTFFCPLSWGSTKPDFTKNTATIHHFSGSWLSPKRKLIKKIMRNPIGKHLINVYKKGHDR